MNTVRIKNNVSVLKETKQKQRQNWLQPEWTSETFFFKQNGREQ